MFRPPLTVLAILAATLASADQSALPQADPGAYLAGRQALSDQAYGPAITYFSRAREEAPDHEATLESLIAAHMNLGDVDAAIPFADRLVALGAQSQPAHLVHLVAKARDGDWQALLDALSNGVTAGPLVDGILRAWAEVGAGRMRPALAAFDALDGAEGMGTIGLQHKALTLALVGDAASADAILSQGRDGGILMTKELIVTRVQLLSQMDRPAEALSLFDTSFGPAPGDPDLVALRATVAGGQSADFTLFTRPQDGIADLCLTLAVALNDEGQTALGLLYGRLAQALRPDHVQTVLIVADILQQIGRPDIAAQSFAQVPQTAAEYVAAQAGMALAMSENGDQDGAISVLQSLTDTAPDDPLLRLTLADMLSEAERETEAEAAYSAALERSAADNPDRWITLYKRGITRDQLKDWPGAEADFRAALAQRPDQPQVLNYLGYSLVERRQDLDEALDMIERAAAAQPDSGAIIDSLAWVLFRLGRYDEAVAPMERAVQLEPVDPIITDHLGDVLWAVGRQEEAVFQWKRALSFAPEEELRARILRKLELGLDAVLEAEGTAPLRAAQ